MKKYSVWQRIQAILCFVVLLCVFAPLALIAISPAWANQLLGGVLLDVQMSGALASITWMQRAVIGAGVLIGVVCALRMLVLLFSSGKKDRTGVSLPNTAEGPIHISVPAVETLVSQGIRDVPGLSDVRMKVFDYHDSISIEMTMSARSDINIPETMVRLQSRIKDYVQESAGVEVRDVRLNVDRVILADGIPALPAGRGAKKPAEAEQPGYAPQSFTWKKDAEEPVVETHEPVVIEAEHTVHAGKSALGNGDAAPAAAEEGSRRGWFGRKGHKRRDEKPEPAAAPAADAPDKVDSVPEFLRRYEMGDDSAAQSAAESANAEPEAAAEPAEAVSVDAEVISAEPEAVAEDSEAAVDEDGKSVVLDAVAADDAAADGDAPCTDASDTDVAEGEEQSEPIVIGDTSEDMSGDEPDEADEKQSRDSEPGAGSGYIAL